MHDARRPADPQPVDARSAEGRGIARRGDRARAIAPYWVSWYKLGKAIRCFGRRVSGGRVAEDREGRHAYETVCLKEGIPLHDRFNAILAAIKPAEFEACLLSWITALHEITGVRVEVANDGILYCIIA